MTESLFFKIPKLYINPLKKIFFNSNFFEVIPFYPCVSVDDDDEEAEPVLMKNTPLKQLLDQKHGGGGGGGGAGKKGASAPHRLQYAEFNRIGKQLN
jgi:hypothetical protein